MDDKRKALQSHILPAMIGGRTRVQSSLPVSLYRNREAKAHVRRSDRIVWFLKINPGT